MCCLKATVCCSLPGQDLLPSSSAEAPLAPHYGTQAAVKSFQQALAAVSDWLHLPVWQTTTLPNFTSAKQTGVPAEIHLPSMLAAESSMPTLSP